MTEPSHPGATFLAGMFGPSTVHPVFVCSLLNAEARGTEAINERFVTTRNVTDIAGFAQKWDRAGRGLFFCVSTLQPNARRRCKETVSELTGLHMDLDFKDVEAAPDEVRRVISNLMCLPSAVNASGHGLHLFWLFKEALEATPENVAEVERLLGLLAHLLGGDPAAAEISRLLRLPGTHNTKDGGQVEVTTEVLRPLRYELADLRDWLELVPQPLIRRRLVVAGNGHDSNPWLEVARRQGYKPPLDAEQRLAGMAFQGVGDAAIHPTQLAVSASLLTHGAGVDEVVEMLLAATRAAAGSAGERWNWRREERAIRKMCATWLEKHPAPLAEVAAEREAEPQPDAIPAPPEPQQEPQPEPQSEPSSEPQPDPVPAGTRKKPKRKGAPSAANEIVAPLVAGTIEALRQQDRDLLLTGGALYVYEQGVWHIARTDDEQHLKVLLQSGARALKRDPKLSLLGAAWKLVREHPELYCRDVAWDPGERIAVANGTLDLRTRTLSPWRPELYLRYKRDVAYVAGATCPRLLEFLATMFADREEKERSETIALLQEFIGACLAVSLLHREQRRALFLVGPSYTGKTELANLIARLVGKPVAAQSVADLDKRWGLSTFLGARAWIRDDAINAGDNLNPARFKSVVTGEALDIEDKNRPYILSVCLDIPVALTANALPQARDFSDAIFNRCLVVNADNVMSQEDATAKRRALGVPDHCRRFSDWIFEQEGPGVLNWALDGLDRLRKRGRYEVPAHVAAAIDDFKVAENPVVDWARVALERSPTTKIDRKDLVCAYNGWWSEEKAEKDQLRTGRWLVPKLRDVYPWVRHSGVDGVRYAGGVALTKDGLAFWERQNGADKGPRGKAKAAALVNQPK